VLVQSNRVTVENVQRPFRVLLLLVLMRYDECDAHLPGDGLLRSCQAGATLSQKRTARPNNR
jgi:hypothetical protein